MSKIKRWWQRLWCLHYWVSTGIPDPMVAMNGKFQYDCVRCGKSKCYDPFNPPVNPPEELL